jgi:hypothetical protein
MPPSVFCIGSALLGGSIYRATGDLDFTGYGGSEPTDVLVIMREVCAVPVSEDGVVFEAASLTAEAIRGDAEYGGLRLKFRVALRVARIPMQIDIGFGNAIEPPATMALYPTLLDMPAPRIRAYPQEAVVAEKLHAMVVLGERNSRYQDFYDRYVLGRQFAFDGVRLTAVVAATFARRQTAIGVALPVALASRFYADDARGTQWRAYLARNPLPRASSDWIAVGEVLRKFLAPLWSAIAEGRALSERWPPTGPWMAP